LEEQYTSQLVDGPWSAKEHRLDCFTLLWKVRLTASHSEKLVSCAARSFAVGYDGSLISGFQAMPQWNRSFNNPSGVRLGLISASLSFAMIP